MGIHSCNGYAIFVRVISIVLTWFSSGTNFREAKLLNPSHYLMYYKLFHGGPNSRTFILYQTCHNLQIQHSSTLRFLGFLLLAICTFWKSSGCNIAVAVSPACVCRVLSDVAIVVTTTSCMHCVRSFILG